MHVDDSAEGVQGGNTTNTPGAVLVSGRPHKTVAIALVASAGLTAVLGVISGDVEDATTILVTFLSGLLAASLLHELLHVLAWPRGSTPAIYSMRGSLATRCLDTPVTRRRAILITLLPTLTLLPLTVLGYAVLVGAARLVFVGALFLQVVGSGSDLVLALRLWTTPTGPEHFVDHEDGWRQIAP